MLSEKAIASFQKIYKKEFGVEISRDEAIAKGTKLLRLFKLIYQPIPKEWLEELIEKRKGGDPHGNKLNSQRNRSTRANSRRTL